MRNWALFHEDWLESWGNLHELTSTLIPTPLTQVKNSEWPLNKSFFDSWGWSGLDEDNVEVNLSLCLTN
jgi:hypothetical protein